MRIKVADVATNITNLHWLAEHCCHYKRRSSDAIWERCCILQGCTVASARMKKGCSSSCSVQGHVCKHICEFLYFKSLWKQSSPHLQFWVGASPKELTNGLLKRGEHKINQQSAFCRLKRKKKLQFCHLDPKFWIEGQNGPERQREIF